jgi:hypothetical protein
MSFEELESLDLSALPVSQRELLEGLRNNDYLGFDTPNEALSTVFSDDLSGFDLPESFRSTVAEARRPGDQEALDYYDTPVKHWTNTDWEEIDMDRVDVGIHGDPTPEGRQAIDRRSTTILAQGRDAVGDDVTKDMRIRIGNELSARDAGDWDSPQSAFEAILEALENESPELADKFAEDFSPGAFSRGSTIRGSTEFSPEAVKNTAAMRQWLLDNDYDTISYTNIGEGTGVGREALLSPEWLEYEAKQLEEIQSLNQQIGRLDPDSPEVEALEERVLMLEDELAYEADDIARTAEEGNRSYISLDPGNVRSADAAFSKENIGKPMMKGSATPGFLGTVAAASAVPATAAYLASQGPSEALSELPQAIGNLGRGLWNDGQEVARRLQRGLIGTDIGDYGRLDEGQPTGLGGALAEDFGSFDFLPGSDQYTVGQAVGDAAGAYNEYVSPHLSPAQEDVLGGAALAASMIGVNPLSRGVGYHFSKNNQPMRRLDPEAYGTGARGAEAGRLQDQEIAPRTFFYNEGTNPQEGRLTPRPEAVVGAGPTYRALLDNTYDLSDNPMRFKGSANDIENQVRDAGFSGYTKDGVTVRFEPTEVDRLGISRFEGEEELARRSALGPDENMVTAELIPSDKTELGRLLLDAPLEVREQYTDQLFDVISRSPGLRGVSGTAGYGAYQGNVNPNYIFRTKTPEEAKAVADIIGGATSQDAVPYISRNGSNAVGVSVSGDSAFTPADLVRANQEFGLDGTRSELGRLEFINFDEKPESEFLDAVSSAFPGKSLQTYRSGGDYNPTDSLWEDPRYSSVRARTEQFQRQFKDRMLNR